MKTNNKRVLSSRMRVFISCLVALAILIPVAALPVTIGANGESSYTITATAGAGGTISPSGAVPVASSGNQTFTIAPNSGYHISGLTVDGAAVAPLVSSYTFTNVTGNHTIDAAFAAGTQEWPLQLAGASTLNISRAEFEAMAAVTPSNTYTDTSSNTWKGVALWRLIAKVDDGDPNTFNSALTSVYSIKLTAADGYVKTIAPPYDGVFPFANSEDIFVANKVMLSGSAVWTDLPLTNPTNASKLWYPLMTNGSGCTANNQRVSALVKIELLNLPVTYTITATAGTGGTITPSGAVSVASSGNQTFAIAASSGYKIADVLVDSVSQGAVASYTFSNVTGNHTINASFSSNQAWPLQLVGASTLNITKAEFEAMAAATPSGNYTDGSLNTWKGVALWRLIAKVDDGDPNTFNSSLTSVYSIKITAADGYTKTIAPSDYASNFVFANSENVFIANKVQLSGTTEFIDLPLTKPGDATKMWYPTMVNGSGIAVGNMRVGATVKIELLNLPVTYTITATAGAGGTITPSGAVSVASSGNQTFAIAASSGYKIADVLVDSVSQGAVASYTFSNVTGNHTINASFSSNQAWPLQLVGASTLNITKAEFEAMAAATPSGNYTDGSLNTWKGVALWRLIAKVDDGDPNTFNSSLTSVYSIKITAADGYTKTIAPSDYASNFVFANSENVFIANKVQLSGTTEFIDLPLVNPASTTKMWYPTMVNGSGIAVGNMRVGATVKIELLNLPVTYTITATAGTGGTISPSGTVVVTKGASKTFNIVPNAGYHIADVVVDSVSQGAIASYTFTNVTGNHAISASFLYAPVVRIDVSPAVQTVASGETFNVDLNINVDVPSRGWQLNVGFDPSKLSANSVTEGGFLKDWAAVHGLGTVSGGVMAIDNINGRITNIAYFVTGNASASGPSGSGTLCSISFTAKNDIIGTAVITPSGIVVSDVNGTTLPGMTVIGLDKIYIGTPFNNVLKFYLPAGWNTFSTPISLDPAHNTLGDILAGAQYDMIYRFDAQAQNWVIPPVSYQLKPCEAYYIHMISSATFTLQINSDLTSPPGKSLYAGWNLISLANLTAMKASDALLSVAKVTEDLTGYTQALSQAVGSQAAWVYIKGQSIPDSGSFGWMWPGKGYWVFMVNPGTLAGFTMTPLP